MIRQPFNSALGRTRVDLSRVTDGIAASLRAFSTAQQLAASPQDNNSPRPTGRQRAAAAFSDLLDLNSGGAGGGVSPSRPAAAAPAKPELIFRKFDPQGGAEPITVARAPLGIGNGNSSRSGAVNIIRGGFRGGFRGRGGGGGVFGRGGAGARGRGSGRGGRGGRGGGGGGRPRRRGGDREDVGDSRNKPEFTWAPEVVAMREAKEIGVRLDFDPRISRDDLAGWGPAVPTTNSRAANEETVIRSARILGSGQPFHPRNSFPADEMWTRYKSGNGVFFPTAEMKKFAGEAMGLEAFPPVPKETKDAVLQSTLLGTYQGPEYAELEDTLGVVRNYVKRDASWNSDAERRVEEKIRSLLPGGRTAGGATAGASR